MDSQLNLPIVLDSAFKRFLVVLVFWGIATATLFALLHTEFVAWATPFGDSRWNFGVRKRESSAHLFLLPSYMSIFLHWAFCEN